MAKGWKAGLDRVMQALTLVALMLFLGVVVAVGFIISPFWRWFGKTPAPADPAAIAEYEQMIAAFQTGDIAALEARGAAFVQGTDPWLEMPWFHAAIEHGTLPVVQWFIAKGALVNGRDGAGESPLKCAVSRDCERGIDGAEANIARALVRCLIAAGADLRAADTDAPTQTPLDLAKRAKRWGVVAEIEARLRTTRPDAGLQTDQ